MVDIIISVSLVLILFWLLGGSAFSDVAKVGTFFRDTWLESKRLRVQELSERRKLAELERE
jgi:hypothetical protein